MNDDLLAGPIAEVAALSADQFAAHHRTRAPVVIRGCARGTPAFERWDIEYLRAKAGAATIAIRVYGDDRSDYVSSSLERMSLGNYLDQVGRPESQAVRYLFGDPSTIFMHSAVRAELQTGFARSANAGLAGLRPDFTVPGFIDAADFVYAALVVGTSANATGLHYDWGGEGKVLVQLRGRKRIVVFPPEQAFRLSVNTLSPTEKKPHIAGVDIHQPDFERFPALEGARGYAAELEPGDAVYWPAFWFHDVTNLDAFNLAVAVATDEVLVHAPLMRHAMFLTMQTFGVSLLRSLRQRATPVALDPVALARLALTLDGRELVQIQDLFRDAEKLLLSPELGGKISLWDWNESLFASLINAMFGR